MIVSNIQPGRLLCLQKVSVSQLCGEASGPIRTSGGQPEDLGQGHTIHSGGGVQLSRAAQAVHAINEQASSTSHRGGTYEPEHTPGSVDLHKPVSQCRGLWIQEISSSRAQKTVAPDCRTKNFHALQCASGMC